MRDSLELRGDVVIFSPHLDDAALSLGATIAHAARQGTLIRVVTVFAGVPTSRAPAGSWDASCGFRTAGEAASARRAEDALACRIMHATPVWLPFTTREQVHGREEAVADAMRGAAAGAGTVLVPGSPLTLPDHDFCTGLALQVAPAAARIGLYVEQPYAVWELVGPRSMLARHGLRLAQAVRMGSVRTKQAPRSPVASGLVWGVSPARARDRAAKRRAIRAYRSQLSGLGRTVIAQIALYERSWGGEATAWLDGSHKSA